MTGSATPASAERRAFSEAEFDAWLPPLKERYTRVSVAAEGDRYAALFMEFNIAGIGATEKEAIKDGKHLLEAYLEYCFTTGKTFAESRKPIPRRTRVRHEVEALISKLLRDMRPRFAGVRQLVFDVQLGNQEAPHPTA